MFTRSGGSANWANNWKISIQVSLSMCLSMGILSAHKTQKRPDVWGINWGACKLLILEYTWPNDRAADALQATHARMLSVTVKAPPMLNLISESPRLNVSQGSIIKGFGYNHMWIMQPLDWDNTIVQNRESFSVCSWFPAWAFAFSIWICCHIFKMRMALFSAI